MKVDEVALWEAFQAVASAGGFSQAARVLGTGVPQISKRISKLEELLGVRLFKRSTRIVKLTDEGKALLPRVASLLEDLEGLENSFEGQKKLSGTVKVACVPFVAQSFMIPLLSKFLRSYPQIKIHLDLNPTLVNLNDSDFDLAIRIQEEPPDSSLVYRKLARNRIICCATPKYLKAHPPIKTPADLANHEVLMLDMTGHVRFGDGPLLLKFVKRSRVSCSNSAILTMLGLADFGVLVRAEWDTRDLLRSGALVQLLREYPLTDYGAIYAVLPSRRYLAPRVRAFLDFLVEHAKTWD